MQYSVFTWIYILLNFSLRSVSVFIISTLAISNPVFALKSTSTVQLSPITNVTVGVDAFVKKITPNHSHFRPAQAQQLTEFRQGLIELLAGRRNSALDPLRKAGYEIENWSMSGASKANIVALVPQDHFLSYGLYLIADETTVLTPVSFEAPHPLFDENTPQLAARLFVELSARTLAVAGASRCASQTSTACDGKTAVCNHGHSEPFRISDMAHVHNSYFEVFHEVVSDEWIDGTAIQIHGFAPEAHDAAFVISDGTVENRPHAYFVNHLAKLLNDGLRSRSPGLTGISCSDHPQVHDLCATTNVQGRYSNEDEKICQFGDIVPASANGRFLHMELGQSFRIGAVDDAQTLLSESLKQTYSFKVKKNRSF